MGRVRVFFAAHPRVRRALIVLAIAVAAPIALLGVLHLAFPYPAAKLSLEPSPIVRDRHGEPLRRLLGASQVWRIPVRLSEMSPALVEATIAAEDRRFREHCGVDSIALLRAIYLNLRHARVISGASTLTMQLAKLIEPRPRTFWGKTVEAFRALQLERLLTKDQILEQYLNRAPYGGNLSGVEAAARAYFGRHAGELDLAQATLLAGLPQAPSRLRPDRNPERARVRRDYVLDRMGDLELLSAAEIAGARAAPVEVRRRPFEWVARHFTLRFEDVALAGDDVRTTLDLNLQQLAEDRLAAHVQRLAAGGVGNGAVVVIEHATGAVRALVGSVRWTEPAMDLGDPDDGQVDGTRARRSPGSTLKPFLYALALDRGILGPSEIVFDVPVAYRDYEPENMDGTCQGPIPLRDALVASLNLPAVRTLQQVGLPSFVSTLRGLGLNTLTAPPERYGLGLALGGCEVTLLALTHAYTVLARGGTFAPLRWIEDGAPAGIPALGARPMPVFSEEACAVITRFLQDRGRLGLTAPGTGGAAGSRIAWKTGTSHGHHDAWCVGYDPQYTIGVWLGNPSGRPSAALVAVESAAPLVQDLFAAIGARTDDAWPPTPAGLYERPICAVSGQALGPHCTERATGTALRIRTSDAPCVVHRAPGQTTWPDDVYEWLKERGLGGTPTAPAHPARGGPRIVSPQDGEKFVLLGDGIEASRVTLRATARSGPLHWFVDAQRIAEAGPDEAVVWTLTEGEHRIVCVSADGESSVVRIRVSR